MYKPIIYVFILFIFSACSSKFYGNSIQAQNSRNEFADKYLDIVAPDGCTYKNKNDSYSCDDATVDNIINKRVGSVRKDIVDYLTADPYMKERDTLGEFVFHDLYNCKNANGYRLGEQDTVMYCDVPLSQALIDEMRTEINIRAAGKTGGKYKYISM